MTRLAAIRLPVRARPYLFAALQALVTTGLSTMVATGAALGRWLAAWAVAWVMIVPLLLLLAPAIWRLVDRLCDGDPKSH